MLGRLTLGAFVLVTTFAQTPVPEVRGWIHEAGWTNGLAGVEVGLYEFRPNEQNVLTRQLVLKTFTDNGGNYSLKPGRTGEFILSASKQGYQESGEYLVKPSSVAPIVNLTMALIRPGSLTGRVIDSEGKPLANFRVTIESAKVDFSDQATTDAEGHFAANNLRPGEYVVSTRPERKDGEELLEYSDAAFKIVDQDVEPSYWPGGLPDRDGVLPVPVAGGASANVGTKTVRKKPYYRVRVTLAG